MNSDKALELARLAYPNDENLRVAYMLGVDKGYEFCREQMLKDAVEVIMRPDDCEIWVNLVGYGYKFNDGDKAKIIIIPNKEDKK